LILFYKDILRRQLFRILFPAPIKKKVMAENAVTFLLYVCSVTSSNLATPNNRMDLGHAKISCVQPKVEISHLTPEDRQLVGKCVHDHRKKDKWLALEEAQRQLNR